CITCHKSMLNPDFENDEQPFKTHPKLNLFLSSQSPHPVEKFGCTSCHAGRGRGTDFISAVHMPSSVEQEKEWEEKYQWHQLHHWETPMIPIQYIEASCFKCHSGETFIENADKLNLGMNLVERAGCYGCHKIEKYKEKRRIGPELNKIASKINEDWAFQWIENPKSFRHNTWMPRFFGQSNNSDPDSRMRSDQELKAIVHYLFKNSSEFHLDPIPVTGNVQQGKKLVASLGCLGCHRIEPEPFEEETTLQTLRRDHGPNLIGMGSKTTLEWIYNWLKQPERYFPTTMMPNMRLTDSEAADISAYLITLTQDQFAGKNVPSVNEKSVDEITLGFLRKMSSESDARRMLADMNLEQKLDYNGKKLIRLYGCFGCHNIPGFENDRPIGTELTYEGSKLVERLDFGFVDIPHTKHAWFTQKLKEPRIFDHGRIKLPDEKLRMPNFEFKDIEVEALVTAMMGFVKEEAMHTKISPRTARNVFVEEGQWIIREYNCQGCHLIEGDGEAIKPTIREYLVNYENMSESEADVVTTSYNPPNLVGEGKKVQPQWLYHFISNPEIIRPWLKTRMPKFALDNYQLNTLVKYFSYLDHQDFPFDYTFTPDKNSAIVKAGELLFSDDYFACGICHLVGDKLPGGSVESWAPNFALSRDRLKPDWIIDWIVNPQDLLPGTKMPTFFDPEYFDLSGPDDILDGDEFKQINALRDYILTIE
ncbi:MAG: cytochrome c, partial [Candidatus Neomarinimicrobiota bacterium]